MALEVQQFTATIPKGTPVASPVTVTFTMDNRELETIDVEVPPGPSGLMGFYIANNGVQWIPKTKGSYLIWDDRHESWAMTDQPNASGWQIVGYNTDAFYDHSVIIRFHVNLPELASAPMPNVQIVSSQVPLPAITL